MLTVLTWPTVYWQTTPAPSPSLYQTAAGLTTQEEGEKLTFQHKDGGIGELKEYQERKRRAGGGKESVLQCFTTDQL